MQLQLSPVRPNLLILILRTMDLLPVTDHLHVAREGPVFVITLQKPPENRLTANLCQALIQTYRWIEHRLSQTPDAEGAVILQGRDDKYFTTVS